MIIDAKTSEVIEFVLLTCAPSKGEIISKGVTCMEHLLI